VFDKLHHVNGNDSAIEVTDTADSGDSPKPLIRERPSLRRLANGVRAKANIEDWSSLARFEKLIKLEMENLAAQKSNGAQTVSTKTANNNILKPEKHVSVSLFNSPHSSRLSVSVALIENHKSRMERKSHFSAHQKCRSAPRNFESHSADFLNDVCPPATRFPIH
jgi:hypothetical protein